MKFLFGLLGLYLGVLVHEWRGAVFGGVIGVLAGTLIQYRSRIAKLEEQIGLIKNNLIGSATAAEPPVQPQPHQVPEWQAAAEDAGIGQEPLSPAAAKPAAPAEPPAAAVPETPAVTAAAAHATDTTAAPSAPREPDFIDKAVEQVKRFFTTGNVVVKVGMIVLFFGVAFLLKYAIDRNAFPVELRFIAVAAGAIVMLIIGWRLRHKKTAYALVIQGGAVGVLYLTVFSAAKFYPFLPLTLAFFLMVGLVVFSCVLAVLQDSRSLAVFATAGGFLAPVLVSTGSGNHVALFSYYALLNAGIFGIAWYKAWRILNWVGFLFTFVIASLWGSHSYRPEFFNTTEPFLILFFLFYVTISILFAHKQPPHLKGLVDGTLVFGTPLVGFTLQSALVHNYEFGLAYSAVGVSAIYIVLAKLLWKKQVEGMRLLTESFLALGIIFASMAIPFALDGRWTAASWAVEGAGMTWIGIRQKRLLPRIFGLLLHVGSALAFVTVIGTPRGDIAVFNSFYMGCLLISLGGLFSGWQFWHYRDRVRQEEQFLHVALLIWGLCWWFGAGLSEIDLRLVHRYEMKASLFFIAVSMLLISFIARRLRWPAAEQPPYLLLPVMGLMALADFFGGHQNPFANLGYAAWIAAFAVQYVLLWRCEKVWPQKLVQFWHSGTLWILLYIPAKAADFYISNVRGYILENWGDVVWGVIPSAAVLFVLNYKDRLQWPLQRFQNSYAGGGLYPVIAFIALWVVFICGNDANPRVLPYIPILNPQDIVQIFAMLVMLQWLLQWKRGKIPALAGNPPDVLLYVFGIIAFIWLSAVVAHTVHFYGGVRYSLAALARSSLFQASISIVWTLTAFTIMGLATRGGRRTLWFTGAGVLAVVVGKLFLIDLANTGTITRIISFITVGILMLIIGYISPAPPKVRTETAAT